MVEFFRAGGLWMYLILLIGLTLGPLGLLFIFFSGVATKPVRNAVGWLALFGLGGAFLAVGLGIAGMMAGQAALEQAIANVDPAHVDLLRKVGTREARSPLWFGLGVGIVVGLLQTIALGFAWAPRPEPPG